MQLAVPVRKVAITALSLDGVWSSGTLFLKPVAETHSGPETVLDRLNDRDLFLPIEIAGERHITLLNKAHLARLVVRDGQPGDAVPEDQENLAGKIEPVLITLAPGHQLSGWLAIQAPDWQARLSDYVNSLAGSFFQLYADDALHLLNKHAVVRIQSQS